MVKKKLTKKQKISLAGVQFYEDMFAHLMGCGEPPVSEYDMNYRERQAKAAADLVLQNVKNSSVALKNGIKIRKAMRDLDEMVKARCEKQNDKFYPVPCVRCPWAGICAEAGMTCEAWRTFARASKRKFKRAALVPDELLMDMKDD